MLFCERNSCNVAVQVKKRAAANCFSATKEEEDVFRTLMFVYVYKLFVV